MRVSFFFLLKDNKRSVSIMGECITLNSRDCLRGVVKREHHTRKHGCYLLQDKQGEYLVVSQKLSNLVSFVNSIATDAASRVSLTALYEIQNRDENRVGGYSKYRWRLRFAKFDDACDMFEQERLRFKHALILGQSDCYDVQHG